MKNHFYLNGKIIQANKKFIHLKERQKNLIYDLLKNNYFIFMNQYKQQKINKNIREKILYKTYEEIQQRDISISFKEVEKYFNQKLIKITKSKNKKDLQL